MVNSATSDKKLLEAAAKAAGIEVHDWRENYLGQPFGWLGKAKQYEICWNPLTDDGDALRLAVRLRLEIDIHHTGIAIRTANGAKVVIYADEQPDPYAATRRAIVRAAAAMGGGDV